MYNADDLFTIIQFYDDNKDVIGTDDPPESNEIIYSETTKNLDPIIIQTAIDSKQTTLSYFQNVLDSIPFNTPDYNRLRRFFIDWHSANRTLIEINSNSKDAFSLTADLLEEIIKGFGFDYSYLIKDKTTRALFLLSLVDLYQIKGSPLCLSDALKFFGFTNTALYEWWLVREDSELYFEGRLIDTKEDFLKEFPKKRYISWDAFEEIKDGHWYYTKDQILSLDQSLTRYIKLPSLTPYFTISNTQNLDNIDAFTVIFSRILSDQWTNFKTTSGQPPKDILITGGEFKLSMLELYLGILYSCWEYNDWARYSALYSFITSHFPIIPERDFLPFVYSEPYSYEKLLYWCTIREDSSGNKQPLDIRNIDPDNTSQLHPVPSASFNPYLPQMEFWTALNQPNLSSGNSDTSLNYDNCLIGDTSILAYDDSVFYPLLNNLPQFPPTLRYLHDNSSVFPNYNNNFLQIPNFIPNLKIEMNNFSSLINYRPTTNQDLKDKLTQYKQEYTRLQNINFILNSQDPKRILSGIPPVETVSDLSDIDATTGTTVLVRQSPTGPQIYIYDGTSWQVMSDGFTNGQIGLNPDLISWIDSQTDGDKNNYLTIAKNLLNDLDIFISTYLGQTQVKLSILFLGIDQATELDPIVNFFKPNKSRLLTFEILFKFNQVLENSVVVNDFGDIDNINLTLPEEMPDTLRGRFPENFDEYTNGFDSNELFDNIDIFVYQDDGFGGTELVPQDEWNT